MSNFVYLANGEYVNVNINTRKFNNKIEQFVNINEEGPRDVPILVRGDPDADGPPTPEPPLGGMPRMQPMGGPDGPPTPEPPLGGMPRMQPMGGPGGPPTPEPPLGGMPRMQPMGGPGGPPTPEPPIGGMPRMQPMGGPGGLVVGRPILNVSGSVASDPVSSPMQLMGDPIRPPMGDSGTGLTMSGLAPSMLNGDMPPEQTTQYNSKIIDLAIQKHLEQSIILLKQLLKQ